MMKVQPDRVPVPNLSLGATQKLQRGVTLLELLFVLALTAVIIIAGLNQYQNMREDAKYDQVKSHVDLLLQAINAHYYITCVNVPEGIPPEIDWISSPYNALNTGDVPLVPNANAIYNPFGSNYRVKYGPISGELNKPVRIVLTLEADFSQLTPTQLLEAKTRWQASTISGSSLTWVRLPSQVKNAAGLWVLGSDLSRFKKQEEASPLCP